MNEQFDRLKAQQDIIADRHTAPLRWRIAELEAALEAANRQLGESREAWQILADESAKLRTERADARLTIAELEVALEKSRHFNRKIVDETCACEHDNNTVKEPCEMHKQWLEAALGESRKKVEELQAEYDQEVISHDIEEKDLKEKILNLQVVLREAERQLQVKDKQIEEQARAIASRDSCIEGLRANIARMECDDNI